MVKHKRVGLIVWGVILIIIAFVFLALAAYQEEVFVAIFFFFFLGGVIMLVFGIINVVKISQYNKSLVYENNVYIGACPSCGREIRCTILDFKPHSRYPEGFMYCPICKKPVSKNVFQVYPVNQNYN